MQFKEYFFNLSFLYNLIPVKWLMRGAKNKVMLPFYHSVANMKKPHINNLYAVKNVTQFKNDLTFFLNHFTAITVDEFMERLTNENKSKIPRFLLSFDDGLESFFSTICPILKSYDISAINFLNPNFIDNKELFFRYKISLLIEELRKKQLTTEEKRTIKEIVNVDFFNSVHIIDGLKKMTKNKENMLDKVAAVLQVSFDDYLKEETPYLSKKQIIKLINEGFYFGAHSNNHEYFNNLKMDAQLTEALDSVNFVERHFYQKHKMFAFPFSDYGVTNTFFNTIEKEKLITFGTAGIKEDSIKNHFQRIPMEYKKIYSAETIIKGELILYMLKKLIGKHKVKRN